MAIDRCKGSSIDQMEEIMQSEVEKNEKAMKSRYFLTKAPPYAQFVERDKCIWISAELSVFSVIKL